MLLAACVHAPVQHVPDAVTRLGGRRAEVLVSGGGWMTFDSVRLAGDSVVGWSMTGAEARRAALPVTAVRWVRPAPSRTQVARDHAGGFVVLLLGVAALACLGVGWLISVTEHT